jgi:uncharacterized surface protein with fasciclin (FAS1) repeats
MRLNYSSKIPTLIAFAAAVALLVTDVYAGHHGEKQSDIVDTAVAAGTFNTLAAALDAGDLIGTLKSDGPFTVFAPTDEAFAKLPKGTVEMLLLPENKDKLIAILTYHVVPGKVTAAEVVTMQSAPTANGSDLAIRVVDETVFINDSRVVATDITASNGIIHVVDAVILPN